MDCLFCKIINGEIPSYTIYEDDIVKVFLDISPVTNGHCLVIPKKHYENIMDIDLETLNYIDKIIKKLYPILKEKLNCVGITRTQNNEYGQDVKHYHMHLIPRYKNDNINFRKNTIEMKDVKEIYNILKMED